MKTIDNLKTENWYYTQMFFQEDTQTGRYCIVFAKDTTEAESLAKEYARKTWNLDGAVKIHLYHKNYKREARKMVEAGNFIWD